MTLPADPSTSALLIVWTESTTTSSGDSASTWPSTVARSVSLARYSERAIASIRSARVRTWAADSSPLTYSTRRSPCSPERAARAATSSSRVDLPMPGSPATSTTEPGTRPPPRTRSNSGTPVGRATARRASTSPIGTAGRSTALAAVVRTVTAPTSDTLPHAWHSPHRPTHFTACQPHSEHRNVALVRGVRLAAVAMRLTVCGDTDTTRHRRAASPSWVLERSPRAAS